MTCIRMSFMLRTPLYSKHIYILFNNLLTLGRVLRIILNNEINALIVALQTIFTDPIIIHARLITIMD